MNILEWMQQKPPGWLGLDHVVYEERLSQLVLLSLEKKRLWADLVAICHCLRRRCGEDGGKSSQECTAVGQEAADTSCNTGYTHQDIRKKIST